MSKFTDLLTLGPVAALLIGSLTLSGVDAHAQAAPSNDRDDDFSALLAASEAERGSLAEAFLEVHGEQASDARRAIAHSILGDAKWQRSCPLVDRDLCIEQRNPVLGAQVCAAPLRPEAVPTQREQPLAREALAHLARALELADAESFADDVEAEVFAAAIGRARVQQTDAQLESFLGIGAPQTFDAQDEESIEEFREFYTQSTRIGAAMVTAYAEVKQAGSPQWNLVAGTRTGMIFETFADALNSIEIPASFEGPQTAAYCEAMEQYIAPLRTQAEQAYRWCIEHAEKHEIGGEALEQCHERLAVLTEG